MTGPDTSQRQRRRILVVATALCGVVACLVVFGNTPTESVVWSARSRTPDSMLKVGSEAPEFELPGADGQRTALSRPDSSEVVLAFVTASCPHCNRLYAALDSLEAEVESGPDVILICRGSLAEATQVAQSHTFSHAVLADSSGSVYRDYRVGGVPAVYLVDARGIVSDRRTGWPAARDLLVREGNQ